VHILRNETETFFKNAVAAYFTGQIAKFIKENQPDKQPEEKKRRLSL
jgi:hypothetical protein